MVPTDLADADRETRLNNILADYFDAIERGEQANPESMFIRHPDLAVELKAFFTEQEQVFGLASPLREIVGAGQRPSTQDPDATTEQAASLSSAGLRSFGDYEVQEEMARGGMGVVYRARQKSLNRLVALKVIRAGEWATAEEVRRFRNEAETVALLDHPHVVPVHEVGEQAGQLYFSMKLVEGGTLAQHLPRYRDDPKAAAALLATVARAVHHAHQRGVLHRDLKPSNILLDEDSRPHVTDFGLARRVAVDSSLTQSGAIVGTPSYVAPEQTTAQKGAVTTATDVYGLGAVLYVLLTGRPPFQADNVLETLVQVREREPEPPRAVNRGVDRDLETVCLKCLAKEPQRRYASALALAEDLDRFLAGQPIQARPVGVWERGIKWARRRPLVVAVGGLLLALLLLGMGNALWWLRQQTAAEYKRIEGETEARAALQEAERWQKEERWSEALSAVRRAQGVLRSFGSDAGLRQEVDELGKDLEMAQRLEEAQLQCAAVKDEHFDYEASAASYADAFAWYGLDVEHGDVGAAAEFIHSRSIWKQLVAALDFWACLQRKREGQEWKRLLAVARAADADEFRDRLRDVWECGDGKAADDLLASADAENFLSTTLKLVKPLHPGRTDTSVKRVETHLRRAQQHHPNDFWINFDLAVLLHNAQPPQLEEAIGYYRTAVALRPQSPGARVNLGLALTDKGRLDEAIVEFHEAIRLKKDTAEAHVDLGHVLRVRGQLDEAITEYREAIRIRKNYTEAHNNLGNALYDKGRLDEAIVEFHEAIRIKKDFAPAHNNLGNALVKKGWLDEAIDEYREAILLKKDDAGFHNNLGVALYDKGRLDEAIAECREAIRLNKDFTDAHNQLGAILCDGKRDYDGAIAEFREAIRLNKDHAFAHHNLGTALANKGQLDEAIGEYREAIRLNKDYADAHIHLAKTLKAKGQLDEAIGEYREAIRIKKDDAEAYNDLANTLERKGLFAEALVYRRRCHELGSKNPRWPYPSAQWLRKGERLVELDGKLPAILSGQKQPADTAERLALAQLCQMPCKQLNLAALRFYSAAFAEEPKLADELNAQHRYNAACAAALSGCGQGADADKLDAKERARLRQQALDWLRADLNSFRQVLEKSADKAGPTIAQRMQHWLQDDDFAGVRGDKALDKLPAEERLAWRKLWADVAEMLAKAQGKAPVKKKSDMK